MRFLNLFIVSILFFGFLSCEQNKSALRIKANQKDAVVFLNGEKVGNVPLDIMVSEGKHRIKVIKNIDNDIFHHYYYEKITTIGGNVAMKIDANLDYIKIDEKDAWKIVMNKNNLDIYNEYMKIYTEKEYIDKALKSSFPLRSIPAKIDNVNDYSEKFVQELQKFCFKNGYKKIKLKNDLLLIDNTDSTYFPKIPIIGKQFILSGKKNNLEVQLTVKRINYSTINYNIKITEFGISSYNQSGQADLYSGFFIGGESDENPRTNNIYEVTEFVFEEEKCYFNIRLGYDKFDKEMMNSLFGKIIKNCNGKIKTITLNNFTTLMEIGSVSKDKTIDKKHE